MKNQTVYVVVHTDPDYVDLSVFSKRESAISYLEELAEENDLELDGEEAYGDDGTFVEIREQFVS